MSEYTEEEQRILAYLTDSVTRGERYVRSKTIADAIGLTASRSAPGSPSRRKIRRRRHREVGSCAVDDVARDSARLTRPASLSASASAARFWSRSCFRPARLACFLTPVAPNGSV